MDEGVSKHLRSTKVIHCIRGGAPVVPASDIAYSLDFRGRQFQSGVLTTSKTCGTQFRLEVEKLVICSVKTIDALTEVDSLSLSIQSLAQHIDYHVLRQIRY